MAYVSAADHGVVSSNGFFARVAAFLAVLSAAAQRTGHGEPFGL